MNTNNVKKYAPRARKAFIDAMCKQAAKYGITKKKIEPTEQKGDLVLIGDRPFPASVIKPRERLVKRIEQQGFDQVMENVAYSWFNRLCAIRYMELKGFLDHGRRVLSAADGSAGVPQILEECLDIELHSLDESLDQAKVRELKLDGTKDEDLYRELLLAQCHALHQAMPFLFEAVADESELLLPENLTKTDSLIRDLVASVPDEDWDHIEIIGWLYQFYISEKKDQVIGKVVKSEDIPAATQLFTPNWIVQYLVQNSVGRQWLQTYPDSPLKEKMPYYIEPAEQTHEVHAQLAKNIPSEIDPESIKVLDPAAGSGHILVEAYKVLKAIYEERGYRIRDIPQFILENNLFGLDIDDRAGQLAGFSLMMLAREDDRRIFSRNIRLNVLSLKESANLNLPSLWKSLNLTGEWQSGASQGLFDEEHQDISALAADNRYQLLQRTLERFEQAKTFGSLIDISHEDYQGLKELSITLCELDSLGDSLQKAAASKLIPYIQQALILSRKYEVVVANPPYMGQKYMNKDVKSFVNEEYTLGKADLFSVYILRCLELSSKSGKLGLVTPYVWMFISSYENLRGFLLEKNTVTSLIQLEYNAFAPACIPVCAFTLDANKVKNFTSSFIRLSDFKGHENQGPKTLEAIENRTCSWIYNANPSEFSLIPGSPFAYWIPRSLPSKFTLKSMGDISSTNYGVITGENARYVRYWWEVPHEKPDASQLQNNKYGSRWIKYNKGGPFRRWYGNCLFVIDWAERGQNFVNVPKSIDIPEYQSFSSSSITWSDITSSGMSMRFLNNGVLTDSVSPTAVFEDEDTLYCCLAFLNSNVAEILSKVINPTMHFKLGDFEKIFFSEKIVNKDISSRSRRLVEISKSDWNRSELSWDFTDCDILRSSSHVLSIIYSEIIEEYKGCIREFKKLEVENNESINSTLNIRDVSADCPDDKLTLSVNPSYIYPSQNEQFDGRFRSEIFSDFIQNIIGHMMGRYSLDRKGLVYALSNNEGFSELVSAGAYKIFPADDDGIIPLTDQEWFPDDATNRFREFVKLVWGENHLIENLDFVAESLCLHAIKPKKSESSTETIRRYLSTQFYKDHLKTYKKRPIYWLFSSGKQKAFECLVYLHRYNEGTLARMRTEYVIPLTAKMAAYAKKLENDKEASGSAAEVKRLEKEIAQLHKQQAELSEFDEKLRHYADQRISLDLDVGVKVNYGKFGDLLAEVKAITGEAPGVLS